MDEISTTYRHNLIVKGSIGYRNHVFFFARLGLHVQFFMASCSSCGPVVQTIVDAHLSRPWER